MPKDKSKSSLINSWINAYPKGNFTTDGKIIFCQLCKVEIKSDRKYTLDIHTKSSKHQNKLNQPIIKQTHISTIATTSDNNFNKKLCEAFLAANIPIHKLQNSKLREFLHEFTKQRIPDESTIRKSYIKSVFTEMMEKIKNDLNNSCIWLTVDETVDSCGRCIGNVIVGKLDANFNKSYLIACKELLSTNHLTIVNLVNNSLRTLWPNDDLVDISKKFILYITDGAPYMKKSANVLASLSDNLVTITCLAHALSLVAEQVRATFPLVDKLISSGKKIFLKAPSRVKLFKELNPDVPLPPRPIITRWGTWLNASQYYTTYYEQVKNVVMQLDSDDANSIVEFKNLLLNEEIPFQLACISANYFKISELITRLEKQDLALNDSIEIIKKCEDILTGVKSEAGQKIFGKFKSVIDKNTGFLTLQKISKILNGEAINLPENLKFLPNQITSFKYAPITSCDVERSFSTYKNILSDKRHKFKIENLEEILIYQYNSQ